MRHTRTLPELAFRVICLIPALGFFLAACSRRSSPSPDWSSRLLPGEVDILVTLESQAPGGLGVLDRGEIDSVVHWFVGSLNRRRPDLVAPLIGEHGAQVAAFGVRANYVGYDNSERMVDALSSGLAGSKPVCLGVVPSFGDRSDHMLVVYEDIDFPWHEFRMGGARGSETGFVFHLLDDGWRLVLITPLSIELAGDGIGTLVPCPEAG